MFKLKFHFFGIGDLVTATTLPENIYNVTGKNCVITEDSEKMWPFKHNPYVIWMDEQEAKDLSQFDVIPDCRIQSQSNNYFEVMRCEVSNSQAEYMCVQFGFNNVQLRHPRLYQFEDSKIIPNKIVVHTTGSDRTKLNEPAIRVKSGEDHLRIMSDEVIDSILKNYEDYDIIQVGGEDDKPLGGHSKNLCGKLDYWEVAKEISSSAKFVGVNSGPMHIANCYPRVEKRIVLMEFPVKTILLYRPGDIKSWLFSWIDPSYIFFNRFHHDVGISFSHTKI